jgi:hypothetical protein
MRWDVSSFEMMSPWQVKLPTSPSIFFSAEMAELADAGDLKSFAERRAGSSPALGTGWVKLISNKYNW